MIDPTVVDQTLSWLVGAEELAKAHGVKLFVALAPVGIADPDYVAFWKPWPRYLSYQLSADARHKRLAAALRQRGMQVIDLREALDGVRGSYRRSGKRRFSLYSQTSLSSAGPLLDPMFPIIRAQSNCLVLQIVRGPDKSHGSALGSHQD